MHQNFSGLWLFLIGLQSFLKADRLSFLSDLGGGLHDPVPGCPRRQIQWRLHILTLVLYGEWQELLLPLLAQLVVILIAVVALSKQDA